MKKQYTKKQITEAIAYWKKQLRRMNESAGDIEVEFDCGGYDGSAEELAAELRTVGRQYNVAAFFNPQNNPYWTVRVKGAEDDVRSWYFDWYLGGDPQADEDVLWQMVLDDAKHA